MTQHKTTFAAYRLMQEGAEALAEIEANGVRVDKTYLESAALDYGRQIDALCEEIRNDKEVFPVWRRRHGDRTKLGSRGQLEGVLRVMGHYVPKTYTRTGRASMDKDTLSHIDLPVVRNFLKAGALKNARSTYLEGIRREMVRHADGHYYVHPSFNLHLVKTYRSSSDNPNFQNIPVRNPEIAEVIRRCYVPRPGNHFVEVDFCLHPDTPVETLGGSKPLSSIRVGDKVFSCKNGKVSYSEVTESVSVGRLPSYCVTFDNGQSVIASDGHKWPVRVTLGNNRGNSPKTAVVLTKTTAELRPGDRMVPFRRQVNPRTGYVQMYSCSAFRYVKEHQLVAEAMLGPRPDDCHVHHKNGDKLDNRPSNLEYVDGGEHLSKHSTEKWNRLSAKGKRNKIQQLVSGIKRNRRSYQGEGNPRYGFRLGWEISCLSCDKVFYQPPSRKAKYCSQACYLGSKKGGLNHKVVKVEYVGLKNMHSICVSPDHNYALSCGVFTNNCQIEVRVSACYHHDPVLVRYVRDKTTDMHRDQACLIFKLKPEQVGKETRHAAKNQWVFPQFYGSVFFQCAPPLWEAIAVRKLTLPDGTGLYEHLKKQGITKLGDCSPDARNGKETFVEHLRGLEDKFWNERFRAYTQWKRSWYEAYRRAGGFSMLTGFACNGPFKRNEVINYPIQGSSFHCELWSLIRLAKLLRKHKMKSLLLGEIHDSDQGDVPPGELQAYLDLQHDVKTRQLPKAWSWIDIPLEVEMEVSPTDRSWHEKAVWESDGKFWSPNP